MSGAISLLVSSERYLYYPATLFNGTYRLVVDYIVWAEKNGMLSTAIESIRKITEDANIGTETMRRNVAETAANAVRNIKTAGK